MVQNPLGKLQQRAVRPVTEPAAPPPSAVVRRAPAGVPAEGIIRGKRRRGSQAIVRQTVRLRREDWQRMCELKIHTGFSAQDQIMMGLGLLFAEYEMEPPASPAEGKGADKDNA